jgi:hypothetical protein
LTTKKNDHPDIDFGGPATYRVVIQGVLSPQWSGRIAGMTITTVQRGERAPHTLLEGPVQDQTELRGVLEVLYELHLPMLKVETVAATPMTTQPDRR